MSDTFEKQINKDKGKVTIYIQLLENHRIQSNKRF